VADRNRPQKHVCRARTILASLTRDSADFCRQLLVETRAALTPGLDFDPVDGGSWVRVSFAGATEEVAEASRRLANWLAG
jgi:aspartate/methionine/tyrosine aminotransferase